MDSDTGTLVQGQ